MWICNVPVNSQILYWAQNPRQGILELDSMAECLPKALPAEEALTTREKDSVTEALGVRKEPWSGQQREGLEFSARRDQLCCWPLRRLWASHLSFLVPHVSPHPKMLMTSSLKCFEIEAWAEYCYSLAGGSRLSEQSLNINIHLIKLKRNSLTLFPLGNKPLHWLGFKVKINYFLPVLKEVLLPESGKFFS